MKAQDSKALWTTKPEKPGHYTYLKEFRVEQCTLFLQHKCTQHRPYTCFNWHFLNQRRRRPIRKRDGSFNYSPDNYCTKFDENTGICPDGDDCPFLHRTAGDTERRYHLRYYKTGVCVHETDTRGYCVKNGPHCAFAHGADDVRPPVYDLRELHQGIEGGSITPENLQQLLQEGASSALVNGTGTVSGPNGPIVPNSLDKERNMVNDDPRWQDTTYVLANYKTEPCKRPPRLCRQGYACPQHHNSRDRRRPPKKFKYRSTACPNVKHSDEWGEPNNCESGDSCQYCHTRTEQQFHPEIYKSSKCNDIQQTGYCPRGVFCAFAHIDQEMTAVRETAASDNCGGTSLADILQSALPDNPVSAGSETQSSADTSVMVSHSLSSETNHSTSNGYMNPPLQNPIPPIGSKPRQFSGSTSNCSIVSPSINSGHMMGGSNALPPSSIENMLPNKEGKGISSSNSIFVSSSNNSMFSHNSYMKAPGSERENDTKKQMAKDNNDRILDLDDMKLKSSNGSCNSLFLGSNGLNNGVLNNAFSGVTMSTVNTVSPLAIPFYPTSNTVESVVGNALDELNLSDLSSAIEQPEFNSITSSLNTGLASSGLIGGSTPVSIPGSNSSNAGGNSFHDRSTLLSNLSNTVSASPSNVFHASAFLPNNLKNMEHNHLQSSFLRTTNGGPTNASSNLHPVNSNQQLPCSGPNKLFEGSNVFNTLSNNIINNLNNTSNSPLLHNAFSIENSEMYTKMRDELLTNRAKLASWEEGIAQARTACEAWKREVDEAHRKIKMTEQAHQEAMNKKALVEQELEACRAGKQLAPYVQVLNPLTELETLPRHLLQQLSIKLRQDIDLVDKALSSNISLSSDWSNVPNW